MGLQSAESSQAAQRFSVAGAVQGQDEGDVQGQSVQCEGGGGADQGCYDESVQDCRLSDEEEMLFLV